MRNKKGEPGLGIAVGRWKHAGLSYSLSASLALAEMGVIEAVNAVNEADWQGSDAFVIFSCDVVQAMHCL